MQFEEDPNTIRSMGSYIIQLESREDNDVNLSFASQTFDQFATWTREGNTISTSADNSFDTDLIITKLEEGRLDLDFDYSTETDIMGVSFNSEAKGTYFLATQKYINNWSNVINGGWILDEVELSKYEGVISDFEGSIDKIVRGQYKSGDAPIKFDNNGEFSASGFFNLDLVTTEFDPFSADVITTSQSSNSFLSNGSYEINGRTLVVTPESGDVRTFTIIDATNEKLVFFESVDGESLGFFVDSKSRIKYTLSRKDYIEVESSAVLTGKWMLADYNANLTIETFLSNMPVGKIESEIEMISSEGNIDITEEPNMITSNGSYVARNTQTNSGNETTSENTIQLFSADNWIKTGDLIQVFGTDFNEGSSTFSIESFTAFELVLSEDVDITETSDNLKTKIVGTQKYVFTRLELY